MTTIKVVGIGGAGTNAVNRMVDSGVKGVEFIAVNTDVQQLDVCDADVKIHIGQELTHGLGGGADPSVGREAMEISRDQLKAALRGADLVFVTAGEGGGTGTGGAPVVAQVARELGAVTIAIVTKPFGFEGNRRQRQALDGIGVLRDVADTVISIPNDRLLEVVERNASVVEAFQHADDILRQGVQGVTDLITVPGLINLDFADVRTIVQDAGTALLGIGVAGGENRAQAAADMAIHSPLLETSIEGARGLLLNITGGEDLTLFEVNEAAGVISEAADDDANIIFGAVVDEKLKGKISITVVATGFGDEVRQAQAPARGPEGRAPAPKPEPREDRGTPFGVPPTFGDAALRHPVVRQSARGLTAAMRADAGAVAAPPVLLDLDLDVFDGPFDLLVTLILRDEIDIWEVRVSRIIAEYVLRLADSGEFDLDATSQFVVLVAALLEMKSRLLLEEDVDEELEDLDPDEAARQLLERLVRYSQFRNAAGALQVALGRARRPALPQRAGAGGAAPPARSGRRPRARRPRGRAHAASPRAARARHQPPGRPRRVSGQGASPPAAHPRRHRRVHLRRSRAAGQAGARGHVLRAARAALQRRGAAAPDAALRRHRGQPHRGAGTRRRVTPAAAVR